MTSIITKILTGAETVWDAIETEITNDWNKVKSALPASSQSGATAILSDLKQAASDAITTAAGAEAVYAPTLAKGIETVADNALAALLGGFSVPLIPVTNAGIDKLVDTGTATFQAWALKAKASLATNNVPAATASAATAQSGQQSAPPLATSNLNQAQAQANHP